MIIFPATAAVVSTALAIQLLTQYAHRKRLPQLAWGVAMSMYALASLAVAAGTTGGWDPTLFRIYWLFGALLNVPYLALGSVALLGRRTPTLAALITVLAVSVLAIALVASTSPYLPGAPLQIPRGSVVWGKHAFVARLGPWVNFPAYLVVVLIAVASGARRRDARLGIHRVRGNWMIALGATVVAAGSSLARYGRGSLFSALLATGVVIMFGGFRLASRPVAARARPDLDPELDPA